MFPDTHLFVMFSEQLSPNGVAVLCHNADKPVDILGMITDQLGQLLQLSFNPLQSPQDVFQAVRSCLLF